MTKYRIFAGLGGGFGGAQYQYTDDFDTLEDAESAAYEKACDCYDSQSGAGIEGWDDFMDEARQYCERLPEDSDDDYQTALEEYATQCSLDACESWIDYHVIEVGSEEDDEEYEE